SAAGLEPRGHQAGCRGGTRAPAAGPVAGDGAAAVSAPARILPLAAPAPAPAPVPSRWILSPLSDLIWFQGSALAGVAPLILFKLVPPLAPAPIATQPALLALLLWGILFDGTHVVGTYARRYLAPAPAARAWRPRVW